MEKTLITNNIDLRGNFFECAVNYGVFDYLTEKAENGKELFDIYESTYDKYFPDLKFHNIGIITDSYRKELEHKGYADVMTDEELADCFCRFWMIGYDMAQRFILTMNKKNMNLRKEFSTPKFSVICLKVCLHTFCDMTGPVYDPEYNIKMPSQSNNIMRDIINGQLYPEYKKDHECFSDGDAYDYALKGEFFNADTLLLIRDEKDKKYCLFISDESVNISDDRFVIRTVSDLEKSVIRNASDFKYKSTFRNIAVENIGSYDGIEINEAIDLAIDKELRKAIQAGSYAYSFLDSLYFKGMSPGELEEDKYINIKRMVLLGKSSEREGIVSMSYPKRSDLKIFYDKYKELPQREYEKRAEKQVKRLEKTVNKYFDAEKENDVISYKKTLHGSKTNDSRFYRITDNTLRGKHADMIKEALCNKDLTSIYLTGAPGIGKTTAILKYLKEHKSIFIYVNPRTAINQDVMEKSVRSSGDPNIRDSESISFTTDSQLNEEISVTCSDDAYEIIKDLNAGFKTIRTEQTKSYGVGDTRLKTGISSDNKVNVSAQKKENTILNIASGFMHNFLNVQISKDKQDFDHITLALTIQACGKIGGLDKCLLKMFPFIKGNGEPDQHKAAEFAKKYDDIIFMIDEISGDDNGISVFKNFTTAVKTIKEIEELSSVNIKLIIADASVQDETAFNIYKKGNLSESIFIKQTEALKTIEKNIDKDKCVINANTYPAKDLHITYRSYDYGGRFDIKGDIKDIIEKVEDFVKKSKDENTFLTMYDENTKQTVRRSRQCIIYLQNKNNLELINKYFKYKGINCELMTSDVSAEQKKKLLKKLDTEENISVILMTSSGARGISFKRVTEIFIFVPEFGFASNLMEIIQLVFRGRGDGLIDENIEKDLHFFIRSDNNNNQNESNENRIHSKIEKINFLTTILLIQSSIETRIYGKSNLINYAITPLGKQKTGVKENDNNISRLLKFAETVKKTNGNHPKADKLVEEISKYKKMTCRFTGKTEHMDYLKNKILPRFTGKNYDKKKDGKKSEDLHFTVINGFVIFPINNIEVNSTYPNDEKFCENKYEVSSLYEKGKEELKGHLNAQNALTEIYGALTKMLEIKKEIFSVNDTNKSIGYIAYPLCAFGKAFKKEEWNLYMESNDHENNIIIGSSIILKSFSDITYSFPIREDGTYDDVPYVIFGSDDFDAAVSRQYANTQLFVSNQTNILSLLFETL